MAEVGIWIEGKAAGWNVDRDDEIFDPRAFDAGIAEFMRNPVLAYAHAKNIIESWHGGPGSKIVQLGVVTDLRRERDGLYFKAYAPRPEGGGLLANIWAQVRDGIMRGVSVGGRFAKNAAGLITEADLAEISIAPIPVNPTTLITRVTPAFEAPILGSCGEACAVGIGEPIGKAEAGPDDLNRAIQLAEFAADLRDLREVIETRQRADVERARTSARRMLDSLGPWSG